MWQDAHSRRRPRQQDRRECAGAAAAVPCGPGGPGVSARKD